MSKIEWADFLTVDAGPIDQDHRKLIELINRLGSKQARDNQDVVLKALDEVIKYAGEHFAREEKLMQSIGFPGYADHKKQHEVLSCKVMEYRDSMKKSYQIWYGGTLFAFLSDWLIRHIVREDRKISDHLRGQNSSRMLTLMS